MQPERWGQIDRLFQAALELRPEERTAFLEQACAGDAELRREVELLLASDARAESFIEAPALQLAAPLLVGQDRPSLIGQAISHYQILSRLGAGGMGEVYLAQDTRLGRKVALKLLPAQFTTDADRLHRFEQEARAASALNHPNIITIFEIGQAGSTHYIVTEFIDGQTLRQQMKSARMGLSLALEVAAQATSALEAAHAAGIMHRDIKPENIMRRRDGLVKVLDFGLAKLIERQAVGVDTGAPTAANLRTEPGTVMGTAHYMSPEQAKGTEVDAHSDLFSLGIVLYEMVAGRKPFAGDTLSHVIVSILEQEPPLLAHYAPEAPAELERIVKKALVKDREARYQTARDLLLDLKELKQELEARAPRQIQPPRPIPSAASVAGEIRKHNLGFAVGLSVLLLAAIGLGDWFFASRASHSAPIESIAVLPFQNASGNAEVEYLSDGMSYSSTACHNCPSYRSKRAVPCFATKVKTWSHNKWDRNCPSKQF